MIWIRVEYKSTYKYTRVKLELVYLNSSGSAELELNMNLIKNPTLYTGLNITLIQIFELE